MVDKKFFYNTTLADKRINHVGQLFDTNAAMKPWSELKGEFSLIKNSYFYWVQLNNDIPKVFPQKILIKEMKMFMNSPLADTISLRSIG